MLYKIWIMSSYVVCDMGNMPLYDQQDMERNVWSLIFIVFSMLWKII